MGTQAEGITDNEIHDEVVEIEEAEHNPADEIEFTETETEAEGDEPEDDEPDEDEFYLGDDKLDSPANEDDDDDPEDDLDDEGNPAPTWVKKLRKTAKEQSKVNKQQAKEIEQLKERLASNPAESQPEPVAELKPKLEDFDYDEDQHAEAMDKWYSDKAKYDAQKAEQEAEAKRFQEAYQAKLNNYNERKSALRVQGYAEAEKAVVDSVPVMTQSAIIQYSDAPEMVILAAGRNADIRKQLAETKDPVLLGKLIGSIEAKARLAPKAKSKQKPTPKIKASGTAETAQLEKAMENARKSGNYTDYMALKRKLHKK